MRKRKKERCTAEKEGDRKIGGKETGNQRRTFELACRFE